jgi:hypothetical protein
MKHNPLAQVADALSGKAAAPAKKTKATPSKTRTREITLKRGAEGGYIATHRLESMDKSHDFIGSSTKDYPLHSRRALHQHIDKHFGDDGCKEPDDDDGTDK